MTKKQLAFTLIELLVVIAIVGILSGLIVVSMNGMTQKATVAKAQVFSNSLRNSLLMNLVSEWKFDDLSTAVQGSTILDSWKGGNNGTLSTNSDGLDKLKTGKECISGKCLLLDGTDDYIDFGNPSALYPSSDMTISMWLNASSLSTPVDLFGKFNGSVGTVSNWTHGLYIYTTGNLGFGIGDGTTNNFRNNFYTISTNNWYNVVIDYAASSNIVKFYVNSQYCSGKDLTLSITPRVTTNSYTLGGSGIASYYFNGYLDDIRFYNAAIPTSQIEEQYYAGLNHLLSTGNIDGAEYQNRLASRR
jgi:prepilin-type N-terminal cleavage/methylation domain-containing protein